MFKLTTVVEYETRHECHAVMRGDGYVELTRLIEGTE